MALAGQIINILVKVQHCSKQAAQVLIEPSGGPLVKLILQGSPQGLQTWWATMLEILTTMFEFLKIGVSFIFMFNHHV